MHNSDLITPQHLTRKAIIYIRPSTPHQVVSHQESLRLLVMLRCGLRVSAVARLTLDAIDWEQAALRIVQGKGRKDRRVSVAPDALAALRTCVARRPAATPAGMVFWNHTRPRQPLSAKGIQKTMERYAKAAGVKASCHSLRHTFASNLLEAGAAVISMKELLGHAAVTSSERYAQLSNQRVKHV